MTRCPTFEELINRKTNFQDLELLVDKQFKKT